MKEEMRACDAREHLPNKPFPSGLDSVNWLPAECPAPATSFHKEEKPMFDPFRYVSEAQLRSLDSPIVCVVTADTIQSLADVSGSPLTDDELRVLRYAALLHPSDLMVEWLDELIDISRDFVRREPAFIAKPALAGLSDAETGKGLDHLEWTIADCRRENEAHVSQVPMN